MIAYKARKIGFGIAVPHDQYLMGRLQQSSNGRKIGFGVMGMARPDRTGLVMDITLSAFRLNPMFGDIAFGEIQNKGFSVIDVNHGMEMLGHGYSLKNDRQQTRSYTAVATADWPTTVGT